jgi:hypothetical protein
MNDHDFDAPEPPRWVLALGAVLFLAVIWLAGWLTDVP